MPRINQNRLWQDLAELAQIGFTPPMGVTRTALSPEDLEGRKWLITKMKQAGLEVRTDQAFNIIGQVKGANPATPKKAVIGSHLDTVPNGGRFDGTLGVLAGLECARIIIEQGVELPWDLWIVNFTDEEGAHNAGTMGSRAMLKGLSQSDLEHTKNRCKSSFAQDLARAGKDPAQISEALLRADDFAFYLELHIEQGKKLEAEGLEIGAVTGIAGIYRYVVTITGEPGHAGTFPMHLRDDALVKAASLISLLPQWAQARNPEMVATVGQLSLNPGAPNVIPGLCSLVVELRSQDTADIKALEMMLARQADRGKGISVEPVYAKAPCLLHETLIGQVEKAAQKLGLPHTRMVSGAGHDATSFAAQKVPTGMVFVPCKNGVSHSPLEEITAKQAGQGCQVLLDSLLGLAGEKFF